MDEPIFTKRELAIMQILWGTNEELSARVISEQTKISKNTIQAVLRKLLEAKYIKTSSIGYSGTVLTRLYRPVMTEEAYLSTVVSKATMERLISNFVAQQENSEYLDHLNNLIQAKKDGLS